MFSVFYSTNDASLIQAGITVTNRKKWDSDVILSPPILPSKNLVSTRLSPHTSVSSFYGTSVLSTNRPSFSTTKSYFQPQPHLEHSDQQIFSVIFIALGLAALVIVVIVGIFLMNKHLKKLRRERAPAENDYQHHVDCNTLVESSSSIEVDPEGDDHIYHNDVDLSSPANAKMIISPVYATVEFLSRCSVTDDYANTFRIAGFLEGDPKVYAEIEIPKGY